MSIHAYSVNDPLNTTERTQVLYKLAAGATFATGALGWLLAWMSEHWIPSIALTAPATIAMYFVLVRLVEVKLWKDKFARKLLGITLPDINGEWKAQVETRTKDGVDLPNASNGTLYISQTWSTLGVEFLTEKIRSHSKGAFLSQNAKFLLLTIEYQVELRRPHQKNEGIQGHNGTSKIFFPMIDKVKGECDLSHVESCYYTDHRETGLITLKKV